MKQFVLFPTALLLVATASVAALPPGTTRLGKPRTETEGITALAFAPQGGPGHSVLLAAAGAGVVDLWDAGRGRLLHRLSGLDQGGICLAFSPDGRLLATGEDPRTADHGTIRLWDTTTGKERHRRVTLHGGVTALAFAPDGKTLASVGKDRLVRLRDVAAWKQVRTIETTQVAHTVAFSADGELLAAGGAGEELTVWDAQDGTVLNQLYGRGGAVRRAAFVPGADIVVWVQGASVRAIDASVRGEQHFAYTLDTPGQAVALLDRRLLARASGARVMLWELTTGSRLIRLKGQDSGVQALALRADGKMMAAGGRDGSVLLWDEQGLLQGRIEAAWLDLASDAPAERARAVRSLAALGDKVVPVLEAHLRGVMEREKRLDRLVADLDADRYAVRERASRELRELGPAIEPWLRRVLASRPPLEVRLRAQRLLVRLRKKEEAPHSLAGALRSIAVLEQIGTIRARKVLEALAQGDVRSSFTPAAKVALARLGKRR
jgi:WD40 repeat protein